MERKKSRKALKIALFIASGIITLCLAALIICMIPCRTEDAAAAAISDADGVTVRTLDGSDTAYIPEGDIIAGLIFYPGARIKNDAYAPLMYSLAKEGILAVSLKVPFNLAFFDVGAADGIKEEFPQVRSWYIGGHSLGAAVAGLYLEDHEQDFDGLVMFAGFVISDLSDTGLDVISIYGDRDGVLTDGLYAKYFSYLPDTTSEYIIEGGNHAGFAYYGDQAGDGEATITKEAQIGLCTKYLIEKIKETK